MCYGGHTPTQRTTQECGKVCDQITLEPCNHRISVITSGLGREEQRRGEGGEAEEEEADGRRGGEESRDERRGAGQRREMGTPLDHTCSRTWSFGKRLHDLARDSQKHKNMDPQIGHNLHCETIVIGEGSSDCSTRRHNHPPPSLNNLAGSGHLQGKGREVREGEGGERGRGGVRRRKSEGGGGGHDHTTTRSQCLPSRMV